MEGIVLKRPIEPRPVIRCQRQSLLEAVHQVRVTDKEPAVEKGIVLARLHDAPRVLVVPSTSREEGS